MAVLQSNFNEDIPVGYPGMEASGELSNIVTGTLEGDDPLPFGTPAYQGTGNKGLTLSVSAALKGFAIARKGLPVTADRAADTFAPGDNVPLKERGVIWVNAGTAANKGQQVYVVTATRVISNSSSSATAATGWFFDDTISAPGLVRIARR